MQLSTARIDDLARGYLVYLHRRSSTVPSLRPISNAQLRKLQTWIALFSFNAELQAQLMAYLRDRGRSRRRERMEAAYRGYMDGVFAVEDERILAQARALLPDFDELNRTSPIDTAEFDFPLQPDDRKAIHLVRWFKHEFMHWADPIKCPSCGGETRHQSSSGHEEMTEDERRVAGRVEVWRCVDEGCGGVDRFLRLNDLQALLRSRRGRCGEFANLFSLFLHSAGLQWRIVINAEDHVWNEYYSPSAGRWVHLDPSEGSADTPLVYDLGWGRNQSYCVAFGPAGGRDVTRGYVSDWAEVGGCQERRRAWLEEDLESMLEAFTARCRTPAALARAAVLPSLQDLQRQDIAEEAYLQDYERRVADAKRKSLGGRTSGTLDWRAQRQEVGLGDGMQAISPRKPATADPMLEMSTGLADITLYGSADILPSSLDDDNLMLSLTPLETDKTGTAFLTPGIKASESYLLDMTFRIRKRNGQDGADGMGLVVMAVPEADVGLYRDATGDVRVIGDGGAGLGYTGIGTRDDFAIELDTYRSVDRCNDPPTPHISLHHPPNSHHKFAKACTAPHTIPDIADGQLYGLRIQHEVRAREAKQVVSAWLRENPSAGKEGDSLFLWQATLPWRADDANFDRVLAFTASTGGLAQAHEVYDWRLWSLPDENNVAEN